MNIQKSQKFWSLLLCALILSGCQTASENLSTNAFDGSELTPYSTATTTPTLTATLTGQPTITSTPLPTATPHIVTLKKGDTLWTIAAKAGLTKEQILAANPNLDPYSLNIGMQIVVPAADASGSVTPSAPTPTAVPLEMGDPQCKQSLTGGLYCFAEVSNGLDYTVQSVNAQFVLTNSNGETQIQPALLPLNHLTSGASLPIFAYFTPPIIADYTVQVQLFSAVPDSSTDSAMIPITISGTQIAISSDGLSAVVSGTVTSTSDIGEFWVAAVAYDVDGNIVAVRQFSKSAEITAQTGADFKMYVYSIAGSISKVVVFGEAAAKS